MNFENLKKHFVDEQDLVLFEEVIGCYTHQLYRSAYIITWIAIVESLKRKIRFFSDEGDIQAREADNKIKEKEASKRSVDTLIIEKAHDLSIITNDVLPEFDFFYIKRCIYAHPYESAPSKEDVEVIIKKGYELVFSKPNQFGKRYIDSIIKEYFESRHSLEDNRKDHREFSRAVLKKIKHESQQYLLNTVFYKLSINLGEIDKTWLIGRYRNLLVSTMIYNYSPEFAEQARLFEKCNKYTEAYIIAFLDVETVKLFEPKIIGIITRFLTHNFNEDKHQGIKHDSLILRVIGHLWKVKDIPKALHTIIDHILEHQPLAVASNHYDNEKVVQRLGELLSRSYDEQNTGINYFNKIFIKAIENYSDELIDFVGTQLAICVHDNNYNCYLFIDSIREEMDKSAKVRFIIIGLFRRVFFNINNSPIKSLPNKNKLKLLAKICSKLTLIEMQQIFDPITQIIDSSDSDFYHYNSEKMDIMIENIEESQNQHKAILTSIKKAYINNQAEIPDDDELPF
jgi:hypothetical protein